MIDGLDTAAQRYTSIHLYIHSFIHSFIHFLSLLRTTFGCTICFVFEDDRPCLSWAINRWHFNNETGMKVSIKESFFSLPFSSAAYSLSALEGTTQKVKWRNLRQSWRINVAFSISPSLLEASTVQHECTACEGVRVISAKRCVGCSFDVHSPDGQKPCLRHKFKCQDHLTSVERLSGQVHYHTLNLRNIYFPRAR